MASDCWPPALSSAGVVPAGPAGAAANEEGSARAKKMKNENVTLDVDWVHG